MNKPQPIQIPSDPPRFSPPTINDLEELLDIRKILAAVQRRFWMMVLAGGFVFMVIAIQTFQITPVYTASARVIVDTRETNIVDLGSVVSGLTPSTAILDTEVQVIRGHTLLKKVVERLNLTEDPAFNPALRDEKPSLLSRIMSGFSGMLKSLVTAEEEEETAPRPARTPEEHQAFLTDRAARILGGSLEVGRLGATFIIDISANSPSPVRAAELANAVADQYLVEQLEAKFETIRRGNEWLDEQLTELRDEVRLNEDAVEEYRSATGLNAVAGNTLTEQQIGDINAQLIVRETALGEAQARLNSVRGQINRGADLNSISEVLASNVISDLRAQQADRVRERAELQTRYGPKHPAVETIINEEAELNRQINSEINRIIARLENDVIVAQRSVDTLTSRLRTLRSELIASSRAQVRLRELDRKAEASRALYEEFLTRFKETSSQEEIAQADARILSSATVPLSPSYPRTGLNLLFGLLLGGAVAGALLLLSEVLDTKLESSEDIERIFGVPSIGTVPHLPGLKAFGKQKKTPAEYLLENPLSAYAESIRNLRASIIFADLDRAAKTVAISSSLPDEGKTSLTHSLGRMSAMSGAKTIIIDGDFRRRQLTEVSVDEPETGFIEHLFGEVTLEEAIQTDGQTGLHVLPLSKNRNTPRDVFGSRAFDTLLDDLKASYDLVIIDTGPVLLMAESRVVASKTDQVIVAGRWRSTNRKALADTLSILREFNANIAGVVMTFVDTTRRNIGGYGNVNYKSYQKYYMAD